MPMPVFIPSGSSLPVLACLALDTKKEEYFRSSSPSNPKHPPLMMRFASLLMDSLSAVLSVSLGSAPGAVVWSWSLKAAAPVRPSRRGVALTQCSRYSHGAPFKRQAFAAASLC
ncbi:hypothetical protein BDP55DRAFT_636137 [Colletotrichum godetiae]|uniref:Uncharacterized protein n=1 Tax=Colletotrichum godetiae TaxID=1209918 RepID=A0AAJ0ETB5_9PEZI|nr:uncharacterized protein BDP55DRAFT_636137 [Colletotrichum godetiae]KAK1671110.1 hypothetical protein BDP55DRAFT_636137 [Colletotrichum godetiae]